MATLSMIGLFLFLSFLVALKAFRDHRKRGGLPYPPGPRPLPIIGNLLDIPTKYSWLVYTRLAKKHGDVMSFHVLGRVVIILGSTKATKDLLEKRGHIFSDRPVIPIFEMMDVSWSLLLAAYGDPWRLRRKIAERGFRPASLATFRVLQETRARVLAARLLESPQEWAAHLELSGLSLPRLCCIAQISFFFRFQGEQLLAMTYGYEAKGLDDRMIQAANELSDLGSRTSLPGSLMVNEFPFLRHIPEWVPWFSYKPLARFGRGLVEEVRDNPMKFVRENMLNRKTRHSIALDSLEDAEKFSGSEREDYETAIAQTLGSMQTAGSDTLVSSMMSLFLALFLHPDVQRRAQDEIDAVTGGERFPNFEDRPRLPFVDAVCREVLRWRPAAPLRALSQ